jgi:hypothetical protein
MESGRAVNVAQRAGIAAMRCNLINGRRRSL